MEQENQFNYPDMETEIMSSAPSPASLEELQKPEQPEQPEQSEQPKESLSNKKPEPETVEVSEQAKKKILQFIQPQESKYHHFQFKNQANIDKLTNVLQNIPEHNITVSYGIPQSTPDITLTENGQTVGKLHLLLCDRRDANKPEKYYVKIYFYHFTNSTLQDAVKSALVSFFESYASQSNNTTKNIVERGGKYNRKIQKRKTQKRKQSNNRKKTNRRR